VAAASVFLALMAIPLFSTPVRAASSDSSSATPAVINPAIPPLFTECPAAAPNTGRGIQITLNANGTATIATDANRGPYDGNDDTLVGVVNNAGVPIPSIVLTSERVRFQHKCGGGWRALYRKKLSEPFSEFLATPLFVGYNAGGNPFPPMPDSGRFGEKKMKMRPPAFRTAAAAAAVVLLAVGIPLVTTQLAAADDGVAPATTPAASPAVTGPFSVCPGIGADTECGFLITLPQSGTATVTSSGEGPFDGSDDTLIGITNNTDQAITTVTLQSTNDIFGFDGDGICSSTYRPDWTAEGSGMCNYDSSGYGGPGVTSFSNIVHSGGMYTGNVNFGSSGLAAGASTFFSLESDLTGAGFQIPAKFTVSKTVTSTGPYIAGSTSNPIVYAISATNDTGAQPGDVTITDSAPTNTTLVTSPPPGCPTLTTGSCNFTNTSGNLSWAFTGIPGGTTVTASFAVTPNSNAAPSVTNTAVWSGAGCVNTCDTIPVTTPVQEPMANFTVTKAVTSSPPYYAGDTATPIMYTLKATNSASATGSGNVAITDMVPTGTTLSGTPGCPTPSSIAPATCNFMQSGSNLTWDLFNVPIDTSVAVIFSVTVNTGTTSVANTAMWAGPGCPNDPIGPVEEEALASPNSTTLTPCPTNTTTTPVTPPISVTITANNTSTTVGTVPTVTCTITGDTLGAPATTPNPATTVTASTGAGTYNGANTCSGAADPRYTFTYVAGNAVVTAPATAPATTPTTGPPMTTTTAAPVTAPTTTPAIAFTGALLDQEWMAGVAAVLLGLGLLFMARWRRRTPKHAATK
jgi:uncharacterized repeat protein (TIGR01451 family)